MNALPEATKGFQAEMNRRTAFWAHRYVLNLAQIKYKDMIRDVNDRQKFFEDKGLALQREMDEAWLAGQGGGVEKLTKVFSAHAGDIVESFNKMSDELMFKYADGWHNYESAPIVPHRDTPPAPSPAPPSDLIPQISATRSGG